MRGAPLMLVFSLLARAVSGCSSDEEPFVIRVVPALGEPAFDPAVARVELRVRNTEGVESAIATVPREAGSLEVPDAAKSGVGSLVLAGLGSDGVVRAYGRTPPIELSGLAGVATISLGLFVQRTSSIVPALKLAGKPSTPRCASIGSRFAVVADGEAAHADVIDLLDFTVDREQAFASSPASIATAGSLVLTIDRDGKPTLFDLATGATATPAAPTGATFADVAFGATVVDETGGAWIVGATRATAPSDIAIRLGGDGTIVARKLLRARKSAAAAWVKGRGLLVAYSDDMVGLELLAPSATAATPLPFPADPRAGGVLVPLDGARVLRIAEDGAAVTLDLTCAAGCMPATTTLADEPRPPRADDHATPLEGGGAVIVRGGRVLRLSVDATKLELLHDAGASPVCTTALSTGLVALAVAGDELVRTIAPAR